MRRDKTLARIILIFSIASLVLAAPAVVRQRHLVTDRSDDESTDGLTPFPTPDSSAMSGSVPQAPPPLSEHEPPDESVHQDFLSQASRLGAPQLNGLSSMSGAPSSQDDLPAGSGAPLLHGDSLPAPEVAQLQNDLPSVSGAALLHNELPSGSGAQPLYEDRHPSWDDWKPNTEIEPAPSSHPPPSRVFDWAEVIASAIAEAAAKEAEDHVKAAKRPKWLKSCFFRCLIPHPRSFKSSPGRNHGHHFS